jgi:hypothetical protein
MSEMHFEGEELIEFHSKDMQSAADHLALRAKALGNAMNQLSQSLNPMRKTWVASPSEAGAAAGASEKRLGTAVDNIIDVINEFSVEVHASKDRQIKRDSDFARLFTDGRFTDH